MNKPDHIKMRYALLQMFNHTPWKNPCAVSLTLKLATSHSGSFERLDQIKASENLRHFRNRLDRAMFGNGYARKHQHIRCVAVYEGSL